MDQERFDKGLAVRKEVLGADYVEKALAQADDFSRPFQEILTEYCWGACWGSDALSRQQRSLLNLGMLAALGRMHEFEIHFRGAITNGVPREVLQGALIQIGVYCGVPAAVECFRIARKVLGELDGEG
jgi:4-carboxymuconolactone decarboxylase